MELNAELQVRCLSCLLSWSSWRSNANEIHQLEEIEALQCIYEGSVSLREDLAGETRSLSIAVGGPHAIELLVHLPVGYPSQDAPIAEVYESLGLSNAQRDEIIDDLVSFFTCLFFMNADS